MPFLGHPVDNRAGQLPSRVKSNSTGRDGFVIFWFLIALCQMHKLLSCEHAEKHRAIVKLMQKDGRLHLRGSEVLQMIDDDNSSSIPFTNVQATT